MTPVGVDTGGTFTDFIYLQKGELKILKLPSTPENPAEAVLEGLKRIGGSGRRVVHGSTVATNALLERKGAKVVLITNRGFEDVIEIGRQNRTRLYDLHYRKPQPLVEREMRLGLRCRVNAKGEVVEELDSSELQNIIEFIEELGAESVAVCFLHSYANPIHEKEVGKLIKEKLSVHVSLSHEILPEFREFERTSTTVVNAYVSPKMGRYLSTLESELLPTDTLRVMQSNGGIISSEVARKEAVRTVLSGPAGGIVSALRIGKLTGYEKLITFDMGGTSTDVSLIHNQPTVTTETQIEGVPIKVPMIDIHTIGAGGGSIAWIDEGGMLRVGPTSAGAVPGPVCYNRGGEQITVTDANLFLRRLVPEHFLGGYMSLKPELVEEPLKSLAQKLGAYEIDVANAIIEIANSNMEKALRKVSIQRGYDPQEFSLVSYGGAGGLHAVALADALNIPRVIVPPNPGIFSAMGMLFADTVKDYSLTVMLKSSETGYGQLSELMAPLREKAIEDMNSEGFSEEELLFEEYLDMRYVGQSYEIRVPFRKNYEELFHKEHERIYRYRHDKEIEIVNLRLSVIARTEKPELTTFKVKSSADSRHAILKTVKTAFRGDFLNTHVYERKKLNWGNLIYGPAIVVEYSSTTLIPPGFHAHVDRIGNLVITSQES